MRPSMAQVWDLVLVLMLHEWGQDLHLNGGPRRKHLPYHQPELPGRQPRLRHRVAASVRYDVGAADASGPSYCLARADLACMALVDYVQQVWQAQCASRDDRGSAGWYRSD